MRPRRAARRGEATRPEKRREGRKDRRIEAELDERKTRRGQGRAVAVATCTAPSHTVASVHQLLRSATHRPFLRIFSRDASSSVRRRTEPEGCTWRCRDASERLINRTSFESPGTLLGLEPVEFPSRLRFASTQAKNHYSSRFPPEPRKFDSHAASNVSDSSEIPLLEAIERTSATLFRDPVRTAYGGGTTNGRRYSMQFVSLDQRTRNTSLFYQSSYINRRLFKVRERLFAVS